MTTDPEILEELKKINYRLGQLTSSRRLAVRELASGFFRALGYTVATTLILFVSVYFLSKINFMETVTKYVEKLIPKNQITVPFALPSLDRP